jgi:signal transduction histidine kinase/CheY-like chemotaxis protein/CHASE3 domain sensor protein
MNGGCAAECSRYYIVKEIEIHADRGASYRAMPHRWAPLHFFRQRWSKLSLRAKGVIIIAIPISCLLVCSVLSGRLEARKAAAYESAKNALEIRAQLQNLFILLISAESEVRNFAVNGREEGIQPLGMVAASVDSIFTKLSDLVRENQDQQQRLTRLKRLVYGRLGGLKDLHAYYYESAGRTKAPAELLARAKISPDVLIALTEVASTETKLQQQRAKADDRSQTRLNDSITVVRIVGALGGLIASLLFSTGLSRRVRGLNQSALRVPEGISCPLPASDDELGRLGCAIQAAGEKVAAQSEELKLALEGAGVLIWDYRPTMGRIRYQAGSDALQHESIPSELLPETLNEWIAVVHPEDRDRVRAELNRITVDGGSFDIEYRVVIRGGEMRWMSVKAQSQTLGGEGVDRLLGVVADITAQKSNAQKIEQQTQELRTSREAFQQQTRILQSVLDSMGDGVVVADNNGTFVLFNPAATQILNGRALVGDPDQWAQHYGLFLPDGVTLYPTDQLPLVRAIRGESVDANEIFVRPAGASEGRWISLTARPLRQEDGEIKGGVCVMRDVTAMKRATQALQNAKKEADEANQAKSEFLSRMSHELRTPLNSILGFAQLLELELEGDQPRDNLRHILKGGYHLLGLINEILDLARIESGRISLSPEPVRIREALHDAIDIVRPLAAQHNVNINADVSLHGERHVRADRQRLTQVLLNLLSNGIKFNRSGGSVTVACHEMTGNMLRLEVIDTGSGISAENIPKMFKPFERFGAEAAGVAGTGLGLALTKRLVEAMGGNIGVESAVGIGSRFYVELAAIDDPALALESDQANDAMGSGRSRPQRGTVLYIEDNASNLNLVERILSHCPGVILISAMQGQLGLDLAALHDPDWILLDVHLPDMPGDEVLRRLQRNSRTRQIPVTVLSADATAGQISRLLDAGARDYLTKPLDVRNFLNLLESTLPKSEESYDVITGAYAERDHTS